MSALAIASWALIAIGCFFLITGAVGVLRLPDVYARSHAAGLTDTGGTMFLIAGMMLQSPDWLIVIKLALIFVFMFFTSPASAHALVHSAYTSGIAPILADDRTKGEAPEQEGGS